MPIPRMVCCSSRIPTFQVRYSPITGVTKTRMFHSTINRVFAVLKMKNTQFCFATQESINIQEIHLTTNSMSSTKYCFLLCEDNTIRLCCQHVHIGNSLSTDHFIEKAAKIAYQNECSLHTGRM